MRTKIPIKVKIVNFFLFKKKTTLKRMEEDYNLKNILGIKLYILLKTNRGILQLKNNNIVKFCLIKSI